MEKFYHPYHVVNISPWPLLLGFGVLIMTMGVIKMFIFMEMNLLFISFLMNLIIVIMWWCDEIRESTFQGFHSSVVLSGLMVGMLLFIVSKVFSPLFLSFFSF